ncbi:phosphoglycolate phosphatase [Halomonadaceae bacterium KBTZ08]
MFNLKAQTLPDTLLLDLDGTLVDSAPDLAAAVDAMLAELERPAAGLEKTRLWVGNGARKLVERALADAFGESVSAEAELLERAESLFFRAYHSCNGHHSRLYPGVMRFLETARARGCWLAIVTNKPAEFTLPLLERLELAPFFGATVSGDSLVDHHGTVIRKPAAGHLKLALDRLGTSAESTWMIGDSESDIVGARNLGVPSVAVTYGYSQGTPVADYGPDQLVDDLTQLL